jgi:hypothetical protein
MRGRQIQAQPDEPFRDFDDRMRGVASGLYAYCAEENLLHYIADHWAGEDVCSHEFAHTIYFHGISDEARDAINRQYLKCKTTGLWEHDYAMENSREYFAELSSWYFGTHGDRSATYVEAGKEGLAKYDPESFRLIDSIYSGKYAIPVLTPPDTVLAQKPDSTAVSYKGMPCKLRLINHTTAPVTVYWIDYDGHRKSYGEILPGASQLQNTFVSHPFVIVDRNGNDIAEYVAKEGNCVADIR